MSDPVLYRRDRITWTGFSMLGVWAFFLYFIGPASTAIGADLELAGAAIGFIGTALAVGTLGSAWLGPLAVRRIGRRRTLMASLVGMSAASMVLATAAAYPAVLGAVVLLGLCGGITANTGTALLSDHHSTFRARAITEANAVASWLGVVSPALLGFFLALPSGWRGAAVVVGLLPLLALVRVRALPAVPSTEVAAPSPPVPASPAVRLPPAFWWALVVVGMAVGLEFSVNFWAAALIVQRTGAELAAAAAALSSLTLGMALGRTLAGPLPNRYPLPRLLVVFFLVATVGLLGLMASQALITAIGALLLTGLGLSVLFPYAQSLAISLSVGSTDRAVGLTALAIGLAIGAAPFLLGAVAGLRGLSTAFSVTFLIALAGILAIAVVVRLQRREPRSG